MSVQSPSSTGRPTLRLLTALVVAGVLAASADAQQRVVIRNGQPVVIEGPQPSGPQPGQPTAQPQPASQPGEQPNGEEKKEEGGEEKKSEGEEKKSSDVERPEEAPQPPDPRELEARPDENGRVPFSFNGQPWPAVLQWLANISDLSLDWQEMPSGYLNLTTQRTYTLPEARDLINRHLQARGYTLILAGEVLSVFKLDNIDPSLVPRVDEVDLYDHQPHDLVKVTFELPTDMEVAKAAEDFKKLLSKNAKLLPLPSTRRVLAIDTAANLRLVSELLNQERMAEDSREIPRRFVLEHARAEKVIETLYVVLGMDPGGQPSQLALQMQMQQMQQQQRNNNKKAQAPPKDKPKVHLAFNHKENSILANAPPAEMRIIERTIKLLDIPVGGADPVRTASGARFPKTYTLENINPDSLMATLEEIGDLDPLTELRADNQADLLFVRADQQDHEKVQKIIDQLDTGGQEFAVFQLRYHAADAVAGTVMELLKEEEEDNNNRRSYYYYSPFGRNNQEEKKKSTLRVTADVENNRLLVRGTAEELQQVRGLLTKLGELDGRKTADGPAVRVVDSLDPKSTDELLRQLRAAWPAMGGGAELIIEPAKPQESAAEPQREASQDRSAAAAPKATGATLVSNPYRLLSDQQPVAAEAASVDAQSPAAADGEAAAPEEQSKKPPVAVTVAPDGRIVLMSDDPAALARAEDLLNTLAPREEQFHEFKIKHTDAYYIWYDLEDYFEEELDKEEDSNSNRRYIYYYDYAPQNDDDKSSMMLSKRRKLRFLYIVQTNSVIVANATPQQLDTIGKLIEIWDQPPRDTDITNRRTGMVEVKYSSPTKIANALKEVYRDLLSSRDKEFQTDDEKSGSSYTTAKTTKLEFAGVEASGSPMTESKPIRVRFDGALSIGVDEVSGMLLISARTEIYDDVVRMITLMDEAAMPNNTVQVRRVSAAQVDSIQRALSSTMGKTWVGGKPEEAAPQQPQQPQENNNDRRRDRDRRRRGGDRGRG